jgi:hypothetical protein
LAAVNTTSTTTTVTNTRDGTQITVTPQTDLQQVGNFVTSVSNQPFIANRIVSFVAYNMRPNQRLHFFFDSINVDAYCAPAQRTGSTANTYQIPLNAADYTIVPKGGNWGDAIYSDKWGRVAGQFNIPAGKFKTGDRAFQIADVDSLALGNDALTSLASVVFTASNLSVTKQATTLTTVTPDLGFVPVTQTVVQSNTVTSQTNILDVVTILPPPPPPPPPIWLFFLEPLAQALTINTPNGEAGIYATALRLFFKQKSQIRENGVTVYLCETENGYPNGDVILPFSKVHKSYDEINISADATNPTTFTFQSPVFLMNGKTYAFVVRPDANDPDYHVWTCNLGDVDIETGYQVYSQPVVGTAFYGATEKQWTALQEEYVKFNLYRANFKTNEGQAVFYNSNNEYVSVYNVGYVNTSASIISGDVVFKSTNSTSNATGGTVNTSVYATINYYDAVKNILYCDSSTGNFSGNSYVQIHRFSNTTISSPNNTTLIAYANSGTLYNPVVDAVVPQLAFITPAGTTLDLYYRGTSNTYSVDTLDNRVTPGYESEFYDRERIVASRSNEITSMSGAKSFTYKARMVSDSAFLSPAIDTVRDQQLVIKNEIDPVNFQYDEFFNSGDAKSKYVSKVVSLAAGQDAEDIQVVLTAFRPVGSEVEVWVKFLNGEDPEPISQKTWTPLINSSLDYYSDPSNPNDFKEYTFTTSSNYPALKMTGTVTCNTACTTVVGTSTLFTTELSPGWFMYAIPNDTTINTIYSRKIISITSNTNLTLESAPSSNATAQTAYLAFPPTTAFMSRQNVTQLTGNVTVSTTNNAVIGNGTTFITDFRPGNIVQVANDSQIIVSVANNTYLTVGTPWSSNASGANVYFESPLGLTYSSLDGKTYTSFKQFQIKIVLKSNDSSKVPIIDDLRALALQM